MNICFSYDHLYPASSRAGRHIETLARRFLSRGHRVFAITTPVDNAQEPEDVTMLRLRESPGAKGHNRSDALLMKAITRFLRQNDVQVLFAEGIAPLSAIATKAAKRAGARTIIRVLADATGIVYSIGHDKKVPPSVLKKRIAAMLEDADSTAASSERCAQLLHEYYDGEIVVIEKCVDLSVFRHTRVTERDLELFRDRFGLGQRPVVVYARDQMRADTILSTLGLMNRLTAMKPEIIYLVCGQIDDADAVKQGIDAAGLANNYRLVGSLSQRDSFAAYAAASMYLAPYDSRASESELLEAMAMRCAIVCSGPKAASAPSVIQPDWNALVFDAHDDAGAAQKIAALVDDPERLRALRDHALETARGKDISTAVEQVEQLCDRMLGLPMDVRPLAIDDGDAEDMDEKNGESDDHGASDGIAKKAQPSADETRGRAPAASPKNVRRPEPEPIADRVDDDFEDSDQGDDTEDDDSDFGAGVTGEIDDDMIDDEGDDLDGDDDDDDRELDHADTDSGDDEDDEHHGEDADDGEDSDDAEDDDVERDNGDDDGGSDEDDDKKVAAHDTGEWTEKKSRRGRRRRGRGRLRHEDAEENENDTGEDYAEEFDGDDRAAADVVADGADDDVDAILGDDEDGQNVAVAVETEAAPGRPSEDDLLVEASKRLRELDPKLTLKDLMPFLRPPKDVYIMSLASASGHHRAGEAIFEAFRNVDQNLRIRQINILDYISRSYSATEVDTFLEDLYQSPSLFGSQFETGTATAGEKAENPESNRETFISNVFGDKMRQFILEKRPDQIILTHFLPLRTIAALKKDQNLSRMRITVVVTDYDFHSYWLAEGVDQYLVPTEKVRYKMIRAGASPQNVEVVGVPVHQRFESQVDIENVRRQLGIRSNGPTVLLRPGGIGPTESILGVIREITNVGQPFNLLVLAGKNDALQEAVRGLTPPRGVTVKTFGFVNNIHEIMAASDLMITRATGHTVAEAFAVGLPMVLLRPTPGVEDRTADWFVERGVAIKAHDSLDLEWIMNDLLRNQSRALRTMREAILGGGRPRAGAAQLAIERVTRGLH